jgi:hypothetical protein
VIDQAFPIEEVELGKRHRVAVAATPAMGYYRGGMMKPSSIQQETHPAPSGVFLASSNGH